MEISVCYRLFALTSQRQNATFHSISVPVYFLFATQIYTFTKFIRNYSLRRQRKPTRSHEAYTDVGSL